MGMIVLAAANLLSADDALRLYEQEPFDRITLDKHNDNAVLKVKPLNFPNRKIPEDPRPSSALEVRLLERPDELYALKWEAIEKVELFEQIVLDEMQRLVGEGRFEEAYDYYLFLRRRYPKLAGLDEAFGHCLFEESKATFRQEQYEPALARLRELHQQNPKWPSLDRAMGATTDKLVERHLASGDYTAARALLRGLAACFPEHAVVAAREKELQGRAGTLLDAARKAADDGAWSKAAELSRRSTAVWPGLPGAETFAAEVHRKYPRVVVGVGMARSSGDTDLLTDWAARRTGRLLNRRLLEYAGTGPGGGEYECPIGRLDVDVAGARLAIEIDPNLPAIGGVNTLTGNDVARRLLAMADPSDPAYRPAWGELLRAVSVARIYRVEAELRHPHVRPERLLQIALPHETTFGGTADGAGEGPYVPAARQDGETVYRLNPALLCASSSGPREIVERHFRAGAEALRAVAEGSVDVLDRLEPWRVEQADAMPEVEVRRYAVPLVHCLIPNPNNALLAHRGFRRAVLYAIHREAILAQLTGGAELPGCRVLSGPLLAGADLNDPIGYAYDSAIEPRPYDPRLAIALAAVARQESRPTGPSRKGTKPAEPCPLRLAHPPHEIARIACASIRQQCALVGIPIELVEQDPAGQTSEPADLVYTELAIWEPVVDARRVLGESGLVGRCSPYMSLALRQLDRATKWEDVRRRLRQIHRLAHDDVAVIPLWQLTDYCAYRKGVAGIGPRPVTLYQHVPQWQPAFEYPGEERE